MSTDKTHSTTCICHGTGKLVTGSTAFGFELKACPIPALDAPCSECRGYGPHARIDGHKYDTCGLDYPAPCCGATTRQAMLRRASIPVLTERDLAIDTVLALPALVHFAREHQVEGEPLDSLARLVVDTAHSLGLGYGSMMFVPWDALSLTAHEWTRLERLKARH